MVFVFLARRELTPAARWLWLCLLLSSTSALGQVPSSPAPDERVEVDEDGDDDDRDDEDRDDDDRDDDECNPRDEECEDVDDNDDDDEADATDRRLQEMKRRAFRDASTHDLVTKEDAAFASWFAAPSAACVAVPASFVASLVGWYGSLLVGSAAMGGLQANGITPSPPLLALPAAVLSVAGQAVFIGAVPLLIVPVTAALAGMLLDVAPAGHAGDVFSVASAAAGVSAAAGAMPAVVAVVPLLLFMSPTDSLPFMVASATAGLVVATATGVGVWWAVRGLHDEADASPATPKRVVSMRAKSSAVPHADGAMRF